MARLPDIEVRRLLAYLKNRIADREQLSIIEDELRGEDGTDFLREPEFLPYFSASNVELVVDNASWQLRIIAYTNMRMIQRGISQEIVVDIFKRFVEFCRENHEIIIVGAYTIFSKSATQNKPLTLRIDVDAISDDEGKAHTVTVFVGSGNTEETVFITLEQ